MTTILPHGGVSKLHVEGLSVVGPRAAREREERRCGRDAYATCLKATEDVIAELKAWLENDI